MTRINEDKRPAGTICIAGPVTISSFSRHLDRTTTDRPVGLGGVPVADLLVNELLERGYRVVIATLSRDVADHVVLKGSNLVVHVGPYRPHGRARDFFRTERRSIKHAVMTENPDIVHAHWSYEFALGALSTGHETLVTLHDWAPAILRYRRDAYRFARLLMQIVVLSRASNFTTVSPYLYGRAHRWRRNVRLIPNGFPDKWLDGTERTLSRDRIQIISINAGFGERKNTVALLRAFHIFRSNSPTAELVLIGDGHEPNGPAHRWALEHGVSEGVRFDGARSHDDAIEALARADLLVHPSLEESFGMTLIEAMGQGTPVIGGTRSGAVPWVLADGEAGILVDVTDPEAIAEAIAELFENPSKWSHYSKAGYEHVSERYRLSQIVDQYVDAYVGQVSSIGR